MSIFVYEARLIRHHEYTTVCRKVVIEKIQQKMMPRCVSARHTVSMKADYMCMLRVELIIEEAVKRKANQPRNQTLYVSEVEILTCPSCEK